MIGLICRVIGLDLGILPYRRWILRCHAAALLANELRQFSSEAIEIRLIIGGNCGRDLSFKHRASFSADCNHVLLAENVFSRPWVQCIRKF